MISDKVRFIIMIVALCLSGVNYVLWGIYYGTKILNKIKIKPKESKIKVKKEKVVSKKYNVIIKDATGHILYSGFYPGKIKAKKACTGKVRALMLENKNPATYKIVKVK